MCPFERTTPAAKPWSYAELAEQAAEADPGERFETSVEDGIKRGLIGWYKDGTVKHPLDDEE